ncbi:MAG TPA: hypothetical protein DEP84_34030 [Chloroflexi bacterium]|nr:hypothetical protein [Chloroflexota bacterium]
MGIVLRQVDETATETAAQMAKSFPMKRERLLIGWTPFILEIDKSQAPGHESDRSGLSMSDSNDHSVEVTHALLSRQCRWDPGDAIRLSLGCRGDRVRGNTQWCPVNWRGVMSRAFATRKLCPAPVMRRAWFLDSPDVSLRHSSSGSRCETLLSHGALPGESPAQNRLTQAIGMRSQA